MGPFSEFEINSAWQQISLNFMGIFVIKKNKDDGKTIFFSLQDEQKI